MKIPDVYYPTEFAKLIRENPDLSARDVDPEHVSKMLHWLSSKLFKLPIGDGGRMSMMVALMGVLYPPSDESQLPPQTWAVLQEIYSALEMAEAGTAHPAFVPEARRFTPEAAAYSNVQDRFIHECLVAADAIHFAGAKRKDADTEVWFWAEEVAQLLGTRMTKSTGFVHKRKRMHWKSAHEKHGSIQNAIFSVMNVWPGSFVHLMDVDQHSTWMKKIHSKRNKAPCQITQVVRTALERRSIELL